MNKSNIKKNYLKKFFAFLLLFSLICQYTFAISSFTLKKLEIKYPSLPGNIESPQDFILKINCKLDPGSFSDSNNPCLKIRKDDEETETQMQERLERGGYVPSNSLPLYFKYFFHLFIIIAISICAIIFIYAGILYLISTGKPANLKEAKIWMQSAIIGLTTILSAYTILYTINPSLTIFKPLIQEKIVLEKFEYGKSLSGSEIATIPIGQILDRTIEKLQAIRERAAELSTSSENYATIQKTVSDIYYTIVQLETTMKDLENISQKECSCGTANCIQSGDNYIPDPKKPCNPSCEDCKEEVAQIAKQVDLLKEKLRSQLKSFVILEIPLIFDYVEIKGASFLLYNAEGIADRGYLNYYLNWLKETGNIGEEDINFTSPFSPLLKKPGSTTITHMGSIFIIKNIAILASTTDSQNNATSAKEIVEIVNEISARGQEIDQHIKTQISGINVILNNPITACNVFIDSSQLLLQEITSTAKFIKEKINGTNGILELTKQFKNIDTFKISQEASKINLLLGYIENRIENINSLLENLKDACRQRNININNITQILYKIQNVQFFYLTLYNSEIWGQKTEEIDYASFYFNPKLEKNKELLKSLPTGIGVLTGKSNKELNNKYLSVVKKNLGTDFLDLSDEEWANITSETFNSVDSVLKANPIIELLAEKWSQEASKNALEDLIKGIRSFLGINNEGSNLPSNNKLSEKTIQKLKKIITLNPEVALALNREFLDYVANQYIEAISRYFAQKGVDVITLIGLSMLEQALKDIGSQYPFLNANAWQNLSINISNILNSNWKEIIPQLNDLLNSKLDQLLPADIVNYMKEVSQAIEDFIYTSEKNIASAVAIEIEDTISQAIKPVLEDSPWLSSLLMTFISAFDTFFINLFIEELDIYVDQFMPLSPYSISIEIGDFLNQKLENILPDSWKNYLNQSLKQSLEQCGTQDCYNIINLFEQAASTTEAVSKAFNNILNQLEDIVSSTPNTLGEIFFPGLTSYWEQKTIYQIMRENGDISAATNIVPKNELCNLFAENNVCKGLCESFSFNKDRCQVFNNTSICFDSTSTSNLSDFTSESLFELTGISEPNFFNKTILEVMDDAFRERGVIIVFDIEIDGQTKHCTTTLDNFSTLFNTPIEDLVNTFNSNTVCNNQREDVGLTQLVAWLKNTSLYDFIINNVDATTSKIIKVFFDKTIKTILEDYINSANLSEEQKDSLNKFINFFTTPFFNLIEDENARKAVKEGTIFDFFSDKGDTLLINLLPKDFEIMVDLMETYDLTAKSTFPKIFEFLNSLEKPWKEILLSWSCQVNDTNLCNWFKFLAKPISWDILFLNAYNSTSTPSEDARFAFANQEADKYYNFLSQKGIVDFFDFGFVNKPMAEYIQINLCSKSDNSIAYPTFSSLFRDKMANIFQNCDSNHRKIEEIINNFLRNFSTSTLIEIIDDQTFGKLPYYVPNFNYLLNTQIKNLWPLYIITHNLPSILNEIETNNNFLCYKDPLHNNIPNLCLMLKDQSEKENCYNACALVSQLRTILDKTLYENIIDIVNNNNQVKDIFEKPIGYWVSSTPPFYFTVKEVIPDKLCATTSIGLVQKLHINETTSCQTTPTSSELYCCVPLKEPLDNFFNFNLRNFATSTIHNAFINYFQDHKEDLWENIKPKFTTELSNAIMESLGQTLGEKIISTTTIESLSRDLASTTEKLLKESLPNILENGIPLNSLQNL